MRLEIGARAWARGYARDPQFFRARTTILLSRERERDREREGKKERAFTVSVYASGVDLVAESTRLYRHDALNRGDDCEGWMFFQRKRGIKDWRD